MTAAALAEAVGSRATARSLIVAALLCAIYALSPRITFADAVLADLSTPMLDQWAFFRATGRFFWPAAYLVLAAAIGVLVSRLPRWAPARILAAVAVLQIIDLRPAYAARRAAYHGEGFIHGLRNWRRRNGETFSRTTITWSSPIRRSVGSRQWGSRRQHFWPARMGLTINAGEIARPDRDEQRAYCRQLARQLAAGEIDHRTAYILDPPRLALLRTQDRVPMRCGPARSRPPLRDRAVTRSEA